MRGICDLKIVWLINSILPQIAKEIDCSASIGGSWLIKLADVLSARQDMELYVVFPQNGSKDNICGRVENINYIGFFQKKKPSTRYHIDEKDNFSVIIKKIQPDLLHVWGTEYIHSLEMINAFGNPKRTIISIQGIIHIWAKHYMADLPLYVQNGVSLRDFLKRDNLKQQQKRFAKRGYFEKEALEKTENFIGRTDWDQAFCNYVNPQASYFFCNEILRDDFYNNQWTLEKCERYSLFISQASYPVKGLHKALEAIVQLKKEFPKVKLYIGGTPLYSNATWKDKCKKSYFSHYIEKYIVQNQLTENVFFLGPLNVSEMVDRLKKTNVFISPSSMENESNSLSEAKIMGVPSVVSYVGGMTSRIMQGIDGYQYQYDESYMLAFYIRKIFKDDQVARKLSQNAREQAAIVNDIETNLNNQIQIYQKIMEKNE